MNHTQPATPRLHAGTGPAKHSKVQYLGGKCPGKAHGGAAGVVDMVRWWWLDSRAMATPNHTAPCPLFASSYVGGYRSLNFLADWRVFEEVWPEFQAGRSRQVHGYFSIRATRIPPSSASRMT